MYTYVDDRSLVWVDLAYLAHAPGGQVEFK